MNIFIVEDEKIFADYIINVLQKNNFQIIGKADSVKSAVEKINELSPQVLFLDIELKDGVSFDILTQIDFKKHKIIFLTAYNEFAIKAFRYSAVDYFVKPIEEEELISRLQELQIHFEKELLESQASISLIHDYYTNKSIEKLLIKTDHGNVILDQNEIFYLQSDSNYSIIYSNDKHWIVPKTLKSYEDFLSKDLFYRIHQSYLINLHKIKEIVQHEHPIVIMKNGEEIPISQRKKNEFVHFLKKSFRHYLK